MRGKGVVGREFVLRVRCSIWTRLARVVSMRQRLRPHRAHSHTFSFLTIIILAMFEPLAAEDIDSILFLSEEDNADAGFTYQDVFLPFTVHDMNPTFDPDDIPRDIDEDVESIGSVSNARIYWFCC